MSEHLSHADEDSTLEANSPIGLAQINNEAFSRPIYKAFDDRTKTFVLTLGNPPELSSLDDALTRGKFLGRGKTMDEARDDLMKNCQKYSNGDVKVDWQNN